MAEFLKSKSTEDGGFQFFIKEMGHPVNCVYLNAIGAAAELACRAAAALRVGAACGGSAVGTAPELGVLATAALLKSMKSLREDLLRQVDTRGASQPLYTGLTIRSGQTSS